MRLVLLLALNYREMRFERPESWRGIEELGRRGFSVGVLLVTPSCEACRVAQKELAPLASIYQGVVPFYMVDCTRASSKKICDQTEIVPRFLVLNDTAESIAVMRADILFETASLFVAESRRKPMIPTLSQSQITYDLVAKLHEGPQTVFITTAGDETPLFIQRYFVRAKEQIQVIAVTQFRQSLYNDLHDANFPRMDLVQPNSLAVLVRTKDDWQAYAGRWDYPSLAAWADKALGLHLADDQQ